MKNLSAKHTSSALAIILAGFAALTSIQPVMASGDHKSATGHHPATSATSAASGTAMAAGKEMAEAEIRKIDMETKKITLKHGEIKNLDMPPMTMVFQVADDKLLSAAKTGDKVKFTAEKIRGAYTVTAIEVVGK